MPRLLTSVIVGVLDRLSRRHDDDRVPIHMVRGRTGEDHAYFYLRKLGYTMVARNFRVPNHKGEIDLIGWEGATLCFIEVKTRTSRNVAPAEAAVDDEKRGHIKLVARDYMRRVNGSPAIRFDVLSIYCDNKGTSPEFELFRNAFS